MKTPLCIAVGISGYPVTNEEEIVKLAEVGFDGFFTLCGRGSDTSSWRKLAKEYGLLFQSMHAPFGRVNRMWEKSEEGDDTEKELCDCLDLCAGAEVPLLVAHAFIGFEEHSPNEIGAERFARVGEYARKLGVRLALENTEGEEYLAAAMEATKGNPYVGFCLDTGHEMCYNESRDMLALYGDRVFGTHFNDNFGVTGDKITWLDDSHVLPFDGIADWENIISRLDAHGYTGPYTFELTALNKPDRHTQDRYNGWTFEKYLSECYQKAVRVRDLSRLCRE